MNESDFQKYSELAQSDMPAREFCRRLLDQSVSKMDIFALLRDYRGIGLAEYTSMMEEVGKSTNEVE